MQDRLSQLALSVALLLLLPLSAKAVCLEGDVSVVPGNVRVAREYRESEYVVVATVKSEVAVPEGRVPGYFQGTDYHIIPIMVFKGTPPGELVLFSENSSGRFPMTVGGQYFLFVRREGSILAVDNCGNSALLSDSGPIIDEVRSLQAGR